VSAVAAQAGVLFADAVTPGCVGCISLLGGAFVLPFVERLPARVVADRFGYSPGYIRLLRHQFWCGKIDRGFARIIGQMSYCLTVILARKSVVKGKDEKIHPGRQVTGFLGRQILS